jgi:protein-arginine deiminase
MRHWMMLGWAAAGCGGDGRDEGSDGVVPAPLGPEAPPAEVLGIANLDDDDEDGTVDWEQAGVAGDNDLAAWAIPGDPAPDGASWVFALSGPGAEAVRVYGPDGALLLDAASPEATLPARADGLALGVEFGGFLTSGTLSLRRVEADGAETDAWSAALLSAPLVLNHHLQSADLVMAMESAGSGSRSNAAMIQDFRDALRERFIGYPLQSYGYDVWVQDEIEFGTLTAPGLFMDLVINSVRSEGSGLDPLPARAFAGPDFAVGTWGRGRVTSQDSFGNLEVSPPVAVGGVEYPLGRVYWGEWRGKGLTDDLADLLIAQKVQAPFVLDVSFLCVGHVDEVSTFVPDPTAPRGFRFYFSDALLGLALVDAQDPSLALTRYADGHGYATAGEMQDDAALRAYNEDIQANHLDPMLEVFRAELALTDDEIIRVPALYEESRWCGGDALALIPATVNMTVSPVDGTTHLFLPDPFFRTDVGDPSSDPVIAAMEDLFPADAELHWVDNWYLYHLAAGEVHCGSNTIRPPAASWETSARHLLGGAP